MKRPRNLSLLLGLLILTPACFAYTGSEGMDLLWKFEQPGNRPSAIPDTTANAADGVVKGNVRGDLAGVSGQALYGFATPADGITWETGREWPTAFTFQAWLRNPGNQPANVIAVGGSVANQNRPWQLHVGPADSSGQRTVSFVFQSWTGSAQTFTSEPFVWERDAWYQLAFAWMPAQVRYKDKDGKTRVEPGVGFRVYLTKAGAEEVSFLFGGTTERGRAGGPSTRLFTVGSAGRGYYPGQLAGAFGGEIDEVSLWLGKALTDAQLNLGLRF